MQIAIWKQILTTPRFLRNIKFIDQDPTAYMEGPDEPPEGISVVGGDLTTHKILKLLSRIYHCITFPQLQDTYHTDRRVEMIALMGNSPLEFRNDSIYHFEDETLGTFLQEQLNNIPLRSSTNGRSRNLTMPSDTRCFYVKKDGKFSFEFPEDKRLQHHIDRSQPPTILDVIKNIRYHAGQ